MGQLVNELPTTSPFPYDSFLQMGLLNQVI